MKPAPRRANRSCGSPTSARARSSRRPAADKSTHLPTPYDPCLRRCTLHLRPAHDAPRRRYDARAGPFLQTDPIGSKDDPNLCMYVGNDPTNMRDPLGLRETRPPRSIEQERTNRANESRITFFKIFKALTGLDLATRQGQMAAEHWLSDDINRNPKDWVAIVRYSDSDPDRSGHSGPMGRSWMDGYSAIFAPAPRQTWGIPDGLSPPYPPIHNDMHRITVGWARKVDLANPAMVRVRPALPWPPVGPPRQNGGGREYTILTPRVEDVVKLARTYDAEQFREMYRNSE